MSLTRESLSHDLSILRTQLAALARFLPPGTDTSASPAPADLDQTIQNLASGPPSEIEAAVQLSRDYVHAMRNDAARLSGTGAAGGSGAAEGESAAQSVERLGERIERVREQAEEMRRAVDGVEGGK